MEKKAKKTWSAYVEMHILYLQFYFIFLFFPFSVRMCLKFFRLSFAVPGQCIWHQKHAIKEHKPFNIFWRRKKSFWSKTICTKTKEKRIKLLHILKHRAENMCVVSIVVVVVIEMNQPTSQPTDQNQDNRTTQKRKCRGEINSESSKLFFCSCWNCQSS